MKGIILAGGDGKRLRPITNGINKQLIPVYDKPMIYYPLSILIKAGIKDILIISSPGYMNLYKKLFDNGSRIGINIYYEKQESPRGLADAFIIGANFIGSDSVALVLGDNIFYGKEFDDSIEEFFLLESGARIFGYYMSDPRGYGVLRFDQHNNIISIDEKPKFPASNYIVPGLYIYDNEVVEISKKIKPSERNEIEISSINNVYLSRNSLDIVLLDKSIKWFDAGTIDSLLEASQFIDQTQKNNNMIVSCLETIAYEKGFINDNQLKVLAQEMNLTSYGQYIYDYYKHEIN